MSSDKAGSPPCGIYLQIDDLSNMLDAIGWVRKYAFTLNQRSGYEKNLSVIEVVYSADLEERVRDLMPIIKDNGLVPVVSGSFDPHGADGILLSDVAGYAAAREALGGDAIIGVTCSGKEDAEAAITAEADYVVLPADPALIAWFTAQSDMLCVARGSKMNQDNCTSLALAGANLVDVSNYVLKHKDGIMQGAVNILHALEQADLGKKAVN